MLRHRAVERAEGKVGFAARQLTETDRNGRAARLIAPLANWASDEKNGLTRTMREALAGDFDRGRRNHQDSTELLQRRA